MAHPAQLESDVSTTQEAALACLSGPRVAHLGLVVSSGRGTGRGAVGRVGHVHHPGQSTPDFGRIDPAEGISKTPVGLLLSLFFFDIVAQCS